MKKLFLSLSFLHFRALAWVPNPNLDSFWNIGNDPKADSGRQASPMDLNHLWEILFKQTRLVLTNTFQRYAWSFAKIGWF